MTLAAVALKYTSTETELIPYEGRTFNEAYRKNFEALAEETRQQIFKTHCTPFGLTQDATNIYAPGYSVLNNISGFDQEDIDEFIRGLPNYESYIRTAFSIKRGYDPNVAEGILYLSDEAAQREFDAIIEAYNGVVDELKNQKKYDELITYHKKMAVLLGVALEV